ncbi:MAG: D-arabitol-phosphate dehydrogenase [Phycisphaerae bacterium]|nr:D-arabitol-phosphate dehydrogenase [Phycisphaerae bacterium]
MKGIEFRRSLPRYVLLKLLGARGKRLHRVRALLPIRYGEVPEPRLPGPAWVRVRPVYAGICGSDLSTIFAKGSPYLAPITSMPFVLGHEVVGRVVEAGAGVTRVREGDRVVLHPALGCRVRGIEPLCDSCRRGRDALCRNITRGAISRGVQTGYCRDTGGGWSEGFVAHESQLYPVPAEVDDATAVLIEPFSCCLHAALSAPLDRRDTALVLGCGSIGLLTIAALRASGCAARIVAAAKYDHQRALAKALGADELAPGGGSLPSRYEAWGKLLGADVLKPEWGKPTVIGGADATFDCVASSASIDDAVRFTRSGGTMMLVGMPSIPSGVDWTPLWFKELTLKATYAYGPERIGERTCDTFEIAIELFRTWGPRLTPMLSRPFELADYTAALGCAADTGRSGAAKTVFRIG